MQLIFLNIIKSSETIVKLASEKSNTSGRRSFVKSIGLGALAWNPLADSLGLYSN